MGMWFAFETWSQIAIVGTAALIVGSSFYNLGVSLFTFHPVAMALAFTLFMPQGVIAYRREYDKPVDQDGKRRIHRGLQLTAVVFALIGEVIILYDKISSGSSIVPHTVHAYFGAITMLLVLVQVGFGLAKYKVLQEQGVRLYRWHGKAGASIVLLGLITVALGVAQTLEGTIKTVILVAITALGVTLIARLHVLPILGAKTPAEQGYDKI